MMKCMFYSAAAFNLLMFFLFAFYYQQLFAIFHITPAPGYPMMTQLFAVLVLAFGIGYLWIARDPIKNRQIILLGAMAKTLLVVFASLQVAVGIVSWQFMVPVSGDLIYAALFIRAYRTYRLAK